jgi:hypothetical protein
MSDRWFERVNGAARRQIDVLVSNLPVGTERVRIAGRDVNLSCHPWDLSVPYYFLAMGTRHALHVSYSSRFAQDATFATAQTLPALDAAAA